MGMAFPLIFVAFVAAAIGVAYLSYLAKKKRREGFALVATQLGMEYWPEDPFGLLSEPFALFNRGDGRGIENVIAGPYQSIDTKAFDYWYYEESTDSKGHTSRTYYRFDCVVVPIDAACSPLTIENENVLTRLADALSFHDIQFESEDFNRMFNVKSPDKKFANDFIDARMMQFLLQTGKGTAFEVMGDRLLCYRRKLAPMEIVTLLGLSKAFLDHVPRVVYSLYSRATPLPPDAGARCRSRERGEVDGRPLHPRSSRRRNGGSAPDAGLSCRTTLRKDPDRGGALDHPRTDRDRGDRFHRLVQPVRLAAAADQGRVGEHRHRAPPSVRPHPEPGRDGEGLCVARA